MPFFLEGQGWTTFPPDVYRSYSVTFREALRWLGWAQLALLALALVLRPKDRVQTPLLITGLLAVGMAGGVYTVVPTLIPGLSSVYPFVFLFFSAFAIGLRDRRGRRSRRGTPRGVGCRPRRHRRVRARGFRVERADDGGLGGEGRTRLRRRRRPGCRGSRAGLHDTGSRDAHEVPVHVPALVGHVDVSQARHRGLVLLPDADRQAHRVGVRGDRPWLPRVLGRGVRAVERETAGRQQQLRDGGPVLRRLRRLPWRTGASRRRS